MCLRWAFAGVIPGSSMGLRSDRGVTSGQRSSADRYRPLSGRMKKTAATHLCRKPLSQTSCLHRETGTPLTLVIFRMLPSASMTLDPSNAPSVECKLTLLQYKPSRGSAEGSMQHNLREFLRHGGSGQYVVASQNGAVYGYRAGISIKSLFPAMRTCGPISPTNSTA